MSKFTDLVRESVIKNWFDFQKYTPKNYTITFKEEDLREQLYHEIERPVLQIYYEYFNEFRQAKCLTRDENDKINSFKEEISKYQFQNDLIDSFPELDRYIKCRVKYFSGYIHKILINLDSWCIDYNFKTLDKIKCFIGDSHNKGQYVCQIIVDKDKIFYYKPRSSKLESRFNQLLSDFIEIEDFVIYTKEDFSIQKEITYITPKNYGDVGKYYYNLGIISAFFYFFNSADMHYENMIIKKDMPYFFDLETITAINYESLGKELDAFKIYMNNSITGSNVFPAPLISNNIDISVVTGVQWEEKDNLATTLQVVNDESDKVEIVKIKNTLEDGQNEIIINGKKINPVRYIENIAQGFTHVGNTVLDNKEKYLDSMISVIEDQKIRQILRPTNTYAKFLNSSLEPYYLQSQEKRASLLSILDKGVYKTNKNVAKYEIENLSKGDIPIFFSDFDSLNLYDIDGNIIEKDFFSVSCKQMLVNKIDNFSEMMMKKQLNLMKDCIYTACFNKFPRNSFINLDIEKESFLKKTYHQQCLDYYNYFSHENGYLFNTNVISDGQKLAVWLTDFSLYESGGILLLSYLREELSIPNHFFREITDTVYSLHTQLDRSLNAYNGIGSELYFLYIFYRKDKSSFFREKIINILDIIEEKIPNIQQEEFDYFTGVSGVLAVLSNIYFTLLKDSNDYENEIKEKLSSLIIRFQKIFMDNKQVIAEKYKAGFAHGLAGIYYSLGLSYKYNKEEDVKKMIHDLINLEEQYYIEDKNDYLDPRDESIGKFYICYGLVGILLARVELYNQGIINKESIYDKVDRLIDLLNTDLDFSNMTYSLCHGIASIIELMLSIKSFSSRKEECKDIIDKLVEEEINNYKNGYGDRIDIDSLMNGKMGKLYSLLRVNDVSIPSFTLLKFSNE